MADGPIRIMRKTIDGLDGHDRAFKGGHAVKAKRGHRKAQRRIGAQLVPSARERHEAVDHAAPGRHPKHDGKHHAQRLRPIGQSRVMQMVRSCPDIEEDQGPEMNNRKPIGINWPIGLLWDQVIHHPKKARGQEEAYRIMAIPPLDHGALHTRGGGIGM